MKPTEQPRNYLFIINDSPYGSARAYHALRLAVNLAKRPDCHVRVFLVGDGTMCALAGQQPAEGMYNMEHMISAIVHHGEVATSGMGAETRGLKPKAMIDGVKAAPMDTLAEWTVTAEHVLVF